jgi:hypothetical protein
VFVVCSAHQRAANALWRSRPPSTWRRIIGENEPWLIEVDDMNATSSETGEPVSDPKSEATKGHARSTAAAGAVTPAAALARHLEWLDFALAAARSEESWRVARLEKATKKSRDKRTSRLTEVREEISELTALVAAIRGLQARKAPRTPARKPTTTRKRSTAAKPAGSTATPRRRRAAGPAAEGPA